MKFTIGVPHEAARLAGELASSLSAYYCSHHAALSIAAHPDAAKLAPPREDGYTVPVGRVFAKDGSAITYDFLHYLSAAKSEPLVQEMFSTMWLTGALLTLGDALASHSYFDHAPELEVVYHLRNGIAHGNRFAFDGRARQRLKRFPAHLREALNVGPHEIEAVLHKQPVLFNFMGPAEVVNVISSVGWYLQLAGQGRNPRRPYS